MGCVGSRFWVLRVWLAWGTVEFSSQKSASHHHLLTPLSVFHQALSGSQWHRPPGAPGLPPLLSYLSEKVGFWQFQFRKSQENTPLTPKAPRLHQNSSEQARRHHSKMPEATKQSLHGRWFSRTGEAKPQICSLKSKNQSEGWELRGPGTPGTGWQLREKL